MVGFVPWVVSKFDSSSQPDVKEEGNEERNRRRESDAKCNEDVDAGAVKKDSISPAISMTDRQGNQGETLVFVDADGVVNVGIRDGSGQSPLLLCEANLARSKLVAGRNPSGLAAIINHVASCKVGPGDDETYKSLATTTGSFDISAILAARLGHIYDIAGPNCTMVLSSSWRKPSHRPRVEALEAAISSHCGKKFTFNERTPPGGDHPEKRLQLIGDFVCDYSIRRLSSGNDSPLRVIVLDDFAATHPKRWNLDDVTSVNSVEELLRSRSVAPLNTFVKLVHTYEEWSMDNGVHVQIGCGLTKKKVDEVEHFLSSFENLV